MTSPPKNITYRNGKPLPFYVNNGLGVTKNTIYPFHLIRQVGDCFAWECEYVMGRDNHVFLNRVRENVRMAARRVAPDKRFKIHRKHIPFLDESGNLVPFGLMVECVAVGKPVAMRDLRDGVFLPKGVGVKDEVTVAQVCAFLEKHMTRSEYGTVSNAFHEASRRLVSRS